jgi:hypothetical protein
MGSHKVISRFGLMHMVATNLCEWLYTLVEETKHEIYHLQHSAHVEHDDHGHLNASHESYTEITTEGILVDASHNSTLNSTLNNSTENMIHNLAKRSLHNAQNYNDCQRTNIMGSLVQNASPFLFPCTIEYSLICAVILYEMWKKVKSIPEINKARKSSLKNAHSHQTKSAYHFSIDCSKAQRGMFAGIVVIVLTIISLIMYFVLHDLEDYIHLAIREVTYYEILLYVVTAAAVFFAFIQMRDLKYHRPTSNGNKIY